MSFVDVLAHPCILRRRAARNRPAEIEQWGIGKPFNVRPEMQQISLKVILSNVFGLHEETQYEQLQQLLREMLNVFGSPWGSMLLFYGFLQQDWGNWSPWGRFLRQRQQVDEILYAEIHQRRKHPDPTRADILELLLSSRDETGQPLADVELRDELLTLLFQGMKQLPLPLPGHSTGSLTYQM
jgi:cytochrome P450